jgi:hypothetical protein
MGPTSEVWLEAARRHGAVVVADIRERSGDALYNSAAIVGPEGFIGTYRKVHLWGAENLFLEPGDLGVPVWKTEFDRMAVAICYDGWFPETYRLAALQGADILCVPTNWVHARPAREHASHGEYRPSPRHVSTTGGPRRALQFERSRFSRGGPESLLRQFLDLIRHFLFARNPEKQQFRLA